jgi:polar amino acid transport system permease protein
MPSVIEYIPFLMEGSLWTLSLVALGLSLGFSLGLPIAIMKFYGARLDAYVWFMRGTPLIVLLSLLYWGVFPALGVKIGPFETSVIALGLRSSAYQSQIFLSALNSVDSGQIIAARSIGMRERQVVAYVLLPQALRISLPSWSNEYAIMLKDSSICFALGVMEILTRARYISVATGSALLPYLLAGVLFFSLTHAGTSAIELIYRRVRIKGTLGAG